MKLYILRGCEEDPVRKDLQQAPAAWGFLQRNGEDVGGSAGGGGRRGSARNLLWAADFFIPMRQLGSFFHIAMNGMAASDKIFRLLDLPEPEKKTAKVPEDYSIVCDGLHFTYKEKDTAIEENPPAEGNPFAGKTEILHGISMEFEKGSFTSIVGESGCGKSTVAAILMGRNKGYSGSVKIGGRDLGDIEEQSLMKIITYISHQSYLFKGTVRDNLLMGKPDAPDSELWDVLERVKLADFMKSEKGLDTILTEKASNLSGGQCQRLALARALLHDSPVYIFDESTSNIDVESENDIMREIYALAGAEHEKKTVILIFHRLANVTGSDNIYVMDKGNVVECGRHEELLAEGGVYAGQCCATQNRRATTLLPLSCWR